VREAPKFIKNKINILIFKKIIKKKKDHQREREKANEKAKKHSPEVDPATGRIQNSVLKS